MPRAVLTTILIVTWRGAARVADCLDALAAQEREHRVIVVDNASDDGTAEVLARHPSAPRVIRLARNVGYAGGLAHALPAVRTPYLAWLNDDARVGAGWLAHLEDTMQAIPTAAAVGAALHNPDGSVQSVGVRLGAHGYGADVTRLEQPVFGFCGGAALLRTAALRAVGGVPAEFFCYYEDTDTAWRLRLAGWHVLSAPGACAEHRHGASTRLGSPEFHLWNERNRLLMVLRCAPWTVALRECARFALITALLPVRRVCSATSVPAAHNFTVRLRVRALAGVLARLPAAVRARRGVPVTAARRRAVWRHWSGR